MHPSPARLGLALPVLACAACATAGSASRPDDGATGGGAERPAAYYEVPSRAPHGDVRVAALGVVTLEPRGDDADRVQAMHVRLIADNTDDAAAWQIDTREQAAALDGYGQSRPAFAAASVGRPPLVTVVPGDSATIDLYYPLPAPLQATSAIPSAALQWRVKTPGGPVTVRTRLPAARVEPPPPADRVATSEWWGTGWYDPFWPDDTFFEATALPAAYHERPFVRVAAPGLHAPR
jgi:hypothetical protein